MSEPNANDSSEDKTGNREGSATLEESMRYCFGPAFFLRQLSAFARDRCPDPEEHLPIVEIHLADGEELHVCHIIGLASLWIALAVFDNADVAHRPPAMRTELVPYQMVTRITIRTTRPESAHLGFEIGGRPQVWKSVDRGRSAEEALRAAAQATATDAPPKNHCANQGE